MRQGLAIPLIAAALCAPQALAQGDLTPTRLAECRLPLRDAMAAAIRIPVAKREKDPESGDAIAVLQPPPFTVIGQPAQGLNVRRSTEYPSTAFVTRIALEAFWQRFAPGSVALAPGFSFEQVPTYFEHGPRALPVRYGD